MKLKSMAGFTLIEVIIVVAILSILAATAIPAYQESVAKAKRADAQGALYGLASAMERFYTENNTYCGSDDGGAVGTCVNNDSPGIFTDQVPVDGGAAYYALTISVTTANTYTLTATRSNPGSMSADRCGDFSLTNTNLQSIANQTVGVVDTDCWR